MKSFITILAIALASMVAHAAHWDNWSNYCSAHRRGYRTHTAKMWGIPVGQSWGECWKHGAHINGNWVPKPTFCVKDWALGVFGEFDVPDLSCIQPEAWTNWNNFCAHNKRGYRTYTAIMEDVPVEVACNVGGANIYHHDSDQKTFVSKPTRCSLNQSNKLQVEYDILSSKC
jgi:hypothetical protein